MCINQSVLVDQILDIMYVISVEFWGPNCRRFSCEKFIVARSEKRRCIRGLAEANNYDV